MPDAALLAGALLCEFVGLAWFALAKEPHWRQLRGTQALGARHGRRLKALGTIALLASVVLCVLANHVSMAVLVWIMGLAAAALAVTFTLSWRASWLDLLIAWIPRAS